MMKLGKLGRETAGLCFPKTRVKFLLTVVELHVVARVGNDSFKTGGTCKCCGSV